MDVVRAVGSALLAGIAGVSTGLGPGLVSAAHAADPYPDGQPQARSAVPPAPSRVSVRPAMVAVTAPVSTAVQAATVHGFYWQLTMAQPVLAGSVLLADRAPGKKEKDRAGRTDEQFFQISRTGSNDVPEAALRAYKHAAATTARTNPSCHLSWTLLAAIGRVESNHGRFGGAVLGSDGVSRPAIVGPQLDGAGPFAAIADSDAGKYDGDPTWDRAVGQMQFLPSTWRSVARDGDGDGRTDPFDIDDSALGAAVYLCGAGDLSDTAGMARAAYRYNHSDYYVSLVLSYAKGYETGVFALPSPPPAPGAGDGHPHRRDHGTNDSDRPTKPKQKQHKKSTDQDNHPGKGHPTRSVTPPPPRPTPSEQPGHGAPPRPSKPAAPGSPSPTPPRLATLQGTWNTCATGYCLDAVPVSLGGVGTAGAAPADFDGDGTVETRAQELAGLVGTKVTLVVEVAGAGGPATLVQIAERPWR